MIYNRQITFFMPFDQKEIGRFGNVSAIIFCRKLKDYYLKEKKIETFIKYKWEVHKTKFGSFYHYPNIALCYKHIKNIPDLITYKKDGFKKTSSANAKDSYKNNRLKKILVDNYNDPQPTGREFFL